MSGPEVGRHVFYIGGFFTGGPEFYRRYLVREAARYARVRRIEVAVADDDDAPDDASRARYTLRAGRFETAYELLRWEDIVLARFAGSWSRRLREAGATLVDYLLNGAFLGMLRLMRRFAGLWLFPFAYYLLAALAAALGGLAVARAAAAMGAGQTLSFLPGLVAGAGLVLALGAYGRTCFAYLFLNDWIFSRQVALDRAPELWRRVDAFADRLADRMRRCPGREYVLVGHSFGASLAPLVAARLGERHGACLDGTRLSLLTLGGSLPLIGLHPAAVRFREAIQRAAADPRVTWVDVSSSYDPINFKRFDPVAGFGLGDARLGTRSPLLLDTRFKHRAEPLRFSKLRLMRLHMQFIMASETVGPFDYMDAILSPAPIQETLRALRTDAAEPGAGRAQTSDARA